MTRYCSSIMLLMLGLFLWFPLKSEAQTEINQRRGIVLYPSDIISVGATQWVQFLKQNNLNVLGIHTDTRMDKDEKRQQAFNMCFTSHVETALTEYGEIQSSAGNKVEGDTDKRIIVPTLPENLEASIKLDGKLEEPLWEQACQRSDFMFPWQEESAPATRFYMAVCGQFCYFAFEVRDEDIIVFDSWDGEITVAKEDRVEFFITAQEDLSEYYCAEIDPLGRVLDYKAEFYRKFDDTWNCTGLEVKGLQTGNGYVVEGRIPRSFFDELMTTDNKALGFGLYRAEFSRGEGNAIEEHWISWKRPESEEPDFHIASSFGEIIFK